MSEQAAIASKTLVLRSHESVVTSDRTFNGHQPDEFLAAALHSGNRVCLLGGGFGGLAHALSKAVDDLELDSVENNSNVHDASRALFREYGPRSSRYTFHLNDATTFLSDSRESYDVVCVDLFSDVGYVNEYFDPDFWRLVDNNLKPDGIVAVNAWGLPRHLYPLSGSTPQAAVLQHVTSRWPWIAPIHFMRNTTIFASDQRPDAGRALTIPGTHSRIDTLLFRLLRLRLDQAWRVTDDSANLSRLAPQPFPTSIDAIDQQFLWRRRKFVNDYAPDLRTPLGAPTNQQIAALAHSCVTAPPTPHGHSADTLNHARSAYFYTNALRSEDAMSWYPAYALTISDENEAIDAFWHILQSHANPFASYEAPPELVQQIEQRLERIER